MNIIFGTGKAAEEIMRFRKFLHITFFIDNSEEKQAKKFYGYDVKNPNSIMETDYEYIIIAADLHDKEMKRQLLLLGVEEKKIVVFHRYELYISIEKEIELNRILSDEILARGPIPFKKEKIIIKHPFRGETYKARKRREREDFFKKYCQGEGLDIGFGNDLILPDCYGWDMCNGDAQYLDGIEKESFDYVHSSHCLEHMVDVRIALKNWFRVVRIGGYLLLLIPHRDLYEKKRCLPSRWNSDHKHMFLIGKREGPDTLDIVEEIRESLVDGYQVIYVKECSEGWTVSDPLKHSDGEYSIEVVIKKIALKQNRERLK